MSLPVLNSHPLLAHHVSISECKSISSEQGYNSAHLSLDLTAALALHCRRFATYSDYLLRPNG